MKTPFAAFLASAVLACAPATLAAQTDTSFAALQQLFRSYVGADSVVGASLLVARGGAQLHRVNIGMGDDALPAAALRTGRDFDPGVTIPNGGWNAPLSDLLTYAAFLTNATGGDAAKQRAFDTILSRKSLDEMWRAVVPLDKARPNDGAMGLSFFLYTRGTERIIGHTGSQAGFRAFLWFNPRTSRVVIAAFNTTSYANLNGADQAQRALNDAVFRYLETAR